VQAVAICPSQSSAHVCLASSNTWSSYLPLCCHEQDIQSTVQRDIQRVLLSSKAYVKHVKGPPVISRATLESLSMPKAARLHQENQACQKHGVEDPVQYARYKAQQLEDSRLSDQARQQQAAVQKDTQSQGLAAYRAWKLQVGDAPDMTFDLTCN
jgi:hypothetical protein